MFSLYSIAIQEALNGAGVLMGYSALVARFAEEGALVAPFAQSVPIEQYLTVEITRNNREDGVLGRVVDLLSWG